MQKTIATTNENLLSEWKNYCPLTCVTKMKECGSDWDIKCQDYLGGWSTKKMPTSYELFNDTSSILIHFQTFSCLKEPSNILLNR